MQSAECRVQSTGYTVQSAEYRVQSTQGTQSTQSTQSAETLVWRKKYHITVTLHLDEDDMEGEEHEFDLSHTLKLVRATEREYKKREIDSEEEDEEDGGVQPCIDYHDREDIVAAIRQAGEDTDEAATEDDSEDDDATVAAHVLCRYNLESAGELRAMGFYQTSGLYARVKKAPNNNSGSDAEQDGKGESDDEQDRDELESLVPSLAAGPLWGAPPRHFGCSGDVERSRWYRCTVSSSVASRQLQQRAGGNEQRAAAERAKRAVSDADALARSVEAASGMAGGAARASSGVHEAIEDDEQSGAQQSKKRYQTFAACVRAVVVCIADTCDEQPPFVVIGSGPAEIGSRRVCTLLAPGPTSRCLGSGSCAPLLCHATHTRVDATRLKVSGSSLLRSSIPFQPDAFPIVSHHRQ